MADNHSQPELPDEEEILAAYKRLFAGDQGEVRRFKRSGLRYVTLPNDLKLIEQNPDKESQWAELAHRGHQIAWLMKDGEYLARVVDGKVERLKKP